MKSTTGSKTERIKSGQIPLQHETMPIDEVADYALWIEVQLDLLELRFADFGTRDSKFASFAKGRTT